MNVLIDAFSVFDRPCTDAVEAELEIGAEELWRTTDRVDWMVWYLVYSGYFEALTDEGHFGEYEIGEEVEDYIEVKGRRPRFASLWDSHDMEAADALRELIPEFPI